MVLVFQVESSDVSVQFYSS